MWANNWSLFNICSVRRESLKSQINYTRTTSYIIRSVWNHFKTHFIVFISTGICYHVPFLVSLLLIFCGKKHWVPFLPTVPICFVLMAVSVAVLPSFVAAGLTLSIFPIYGVIIVNGLCAGLSQSLVSRMVVLFPGGKSSLLIRCGECEWYVFCVCV